MLGSKNAGATLAVSDLQRARDYYENMLGLEPLQEDPGSILYKSGNSVLLVYASEYAGTNQATAATWAVGDDLDAIVQRPQDQGRHVRALRRLAGHDARGRCARDGEVKGVWLKDPDGNILSLVSMTM